MHLSVKNNILHFPTNGHPLDRLVSDLQNILSKQKGRMMPPAKTSQDPISSFHPPSQPT